MKARIEIGVNKREPRLDFGMINDAIFKLKVKEDWWIEYCRKRYEFEVMHNKLIDRLPYHIFKRLKSE